MDLLKLLQATGQQDQIVNTLASQFGLQGNQANSAVSSIMGALSGGMQQQVKTNGIDSIANVAQDSTLQQLVDQPQNLANSTDAGNNILGQLLGSKEASRQVAANVEQQSGVSADIIKKMLPMVAAAAMGSMGKQAQASGGSAGITGMLSSFLDQDGDGSMIDDVIGMLGKR